MANLITLTTLQAYRPVADMNAARVDPYITEAQINDLRPFLGEALYYDFITNIAQTKYADLLNGKTYSYNGNTIQFDGVKPMLAYFSLARIVANQQVNITSYGVVQKTLNQSQPVDNSTLKLQINDLRSVAIYHQAQAEKFLDTNYSTYTLWRKSGPESVKTGLNFFSA